MRSRDLSSLLRDRDLARLFRREARVWIVALTFGAVLFLIL